MKLIFNIGGTNIKLATSDDGKTLNNTRVIPTPQDFDQGIQTIKQIAGEITQDNTISSVAGGIAGKLSEDKSQMQKSPHLPNWANKPLKETLQSIFNCPVFLENDTALEGLGEANFGAGKDKKIVAFISIGTGVGGVRVVNGEIDPNAHGFEPGHHIIVPDGNDCHCGGKGHLETYIGGAYLEKIHGKKGEHLSESEVWDQVARYLAIGLNNISVLWSPEIIVLGGTVTKSIPLDKVKQYLENELSIFPQAPQIQTSSLEYPGLHGALHLISSAGK